MLLLLLLLLQVIKNPFTRHMPAGAHVYGLEVGGQLYSPRALAQSLPDDGLPIVFVIGATSAGSITTAEHPYIQKMVCISEYPLSGACATNRLCGAIESHWGIV